MNNESGIYKITNTINNKVYVGKSTDIKERWKYHIKDLNSNQHHSYKLQEDWNRYGKDNFKFEIIKNMSNILNDYCLYIYEDRYIKEYKAIETGYNSQETLQCMLDGNIPCCLDILIDTLNIIELNNGEYPNDLLMFVKSNLDKFNYKEVEYNIPIDEKYKPILGIESIPIKRFAYYIKDKYRKYKCNYKTLGARDLDFMEYLTNNNIDINRINDSDTISYEDYCCNIFNYLDYCKENRIGYR